MARPIKIEILADERDAKRGFASTERGLSGLTKAAGVAGLAIAGAFVGAGKALFTIGGQFETVANNITRGTGALGDELGRMVENSKNVLRTVPETGDVVSRTLADVNTFFGVTGKQLEETTKQYLDFARVAEVDVTTAVNKLDGAMTQFGEDVAMTDEVMGDLLRISQTTGTEMGNLLDQLQTFGPIFANANFSLEETVAFMGQLEQAGVAITRIGPGLNAFFRRTAEAGEEPRRAFANIIDQMEKAENASVALNIATEAFGAEGAQRFTSAVLSGAVSLEDLNSLLGEGAGLLADQAEATETFSDKWNQFKNNVLVGLEPLATAFFGAVEGGLERLTPLIDPFVAKLAQISDWFIEDAAPAIDRWRERFVDGIETVGDEISDWRSEANSALRDVNRELDGQASGSLSRWREAWASAGRLVARVNTVMEGFGIDLRTTLRNALLFAERDVKRLASAFFALIGAVGIVVASIVNALGEIVFIIEKIQEAWKRLVSTFSTRIDIPSFDLPSLPFIGGGGRRRAMGVSSQTGGATTINERAGSEQVLLPPGAGVRPAHMNRNQGGDTYIINGSNLTGPQLASEIAWRKRIGDGR